MGQTGDKFRRRFSEASLTAGALLAAAPLLALSKKDKADKTEKTDKNDDGNNGNGAGNNKNNNDQESAKNQNEHAETKSNDNQNDGDGDGANGGKGGGPRNRDGDAGSQDDKSGKDARNNQHQAAANDNGDEQTDDSASGHQAGAGHAQGFVDLSQQADTTPTPIPDVTTPPATTAPVDINGLPSIQTPDGNVVAGIDEDTGRLVANSGGVEASVGPGGPLVIIPDEQVVTPVETTRPVLGVVVGDGTTVASGSTSGADTTSSDTTSTDTTSTDTTGGDNNTDFAS